MSENNTSNISSTKEASTSSLSSRRSGSNGSASRRRPRKKKKNQIPAGIIVTLIVILIAVLLSKVSATASLYWILGVSFGAVLQRGRFCFTASMRDPYLTGSTTLTRAVLIAFALTTIGFTAIKYGYFVKGLPIPGMGYVVPISLATIAGGFIFGIGMVIAGGCASGTLMRIGEGFQMQIISLTFFAIGSLWGAHDFGWWKYNVISKGKAIFLPDVFGWAGALVIQLGLIFAIYYFAQRYQEKQTH
ncbi:YeeE/YedE thiosulfate transporter family protein [Clostridiaceae bacterium HSG29]|nr:YeeE/YedE thiosulfate transporter family protein [Clostridiaceae bacterium HSG29]